MATGWLGRKWPAPVMKPMWPFYSAGIIIIWAIGKGANAMAGSEEFKNDPRNHYRKNAVEEH